MQLIKEEAVHFKFAAAHIQEVSNCFQIYFAFKAK